MPLSPAATRDEPNMSLEYKPPEIAPEIVTPCDQSEFISASIAANEEGLFEQYDAAQCNLEYIRMATRDVIWGFQNGAVEDAYNMSLVHTRRGGMAIFLVCAAIGSTLFTKVQHIDTITLTVAAVLATVFHGRLTWMQARALCGHVLPITCFLYLLVNRIIETFFQDRSGAQTCDVVGTAEGTAITGLSGPLAASTLASAWWSTTMITVVQIGVYVFDPYADPAMRIRSSVFGLFLCAFVTFLLSQRRVTFVRSLHSEYLQNQLLEKATEEKKKAGLKVFMCSSLVLPVMIPNCAQVNNLKTLLMKTSHDLRTPLSTIQSGCRTLLTSVDNRQNTPDLTQKVTVMMTASNTLSLNFVNGLSFGVKVWHSAC